MASKVLDVPGGTAHPRAPPLSSRSKPHRCRTEALAAACGCTPAGGRPGATSVAGTAKQQTRYLSRPPAKLPRRPASGFRTLCLACRLGKWHRFTELGSRGRGGEDAVVTDATCASLHVRISDRVWISPHIGVCVRISPQTVVLSCVSLRVGSCGTQRSATPAPAVPACGGRERSERALTARAVARRVAAALIYHTRTCGIGVAAPESRIHRYR